MSFPGFKPSCAFPSQWIKSTFLTMSSGPPGRGPSPTLQPHLSHLQLSPLPLGHTDCLAVPETFQPCSYLRVFALTLPSTWKALPPACSLTLSLFSTFSSDVTPVKDPSKMLRFLLVYSHPTSHGIYFCLASCFPGCFIGTSSMLYPLSCKQCHTS